MAINVTLSEAKPQEEKPFPKLMKGTDSSPDFIVLFFSPEKGTCMTSSGEYVVGERYNRACTTFIDYNEPITIQNA